MTTLAFPELEEVQGKLNERRKTLHTIWDEAGPERDMAKVKSLDGDSQAKVDAIRAINDEIDELAKKAEDLTVLRKSVGHAEAYEADGGRGEPGDGTSRKGFCRLGQAMREAGLLKAGAKGDLSDVDLKALFETSTGWAPESTRGPRLVDAVAAPFLTVLSLLPRTTTTQPAIKYLEETTYTNNAAETAEGAPKPEAALGTTERTVSVAKVAVTLPVTDEQFEDEPRAEDYVNNRLERMLWERLAGQVIVGDGNAPNMRGILNVVGIQTQAKGADPTPDAVYKAIVKVMTTGGAFPNGYVTNPLDWQDVRLLRTTDGIYIWGNPSDPGPDRIWGLQVALVQQMTENTGLVGDFANYSELTFRKGVTIDTGYVNNQFRENEKTVRAEFRAVPLWYRPAAFCSVTGI